MSDARRWAPPGPGWLGLSIGLALGLGGCGGSQVGDLQPGGGDAINLVEVAGLAEVNSVEIIMLPEPDQRSTGAEETLTVLDDPATVSQIVAALDGSLPLTPRALCLERYQLRFQKSSGEQLTFGYSCDDGGTFLRGDQSFWQGGEVQPPQAFRELITPYLPSDAAEREGSP